MRTFSVLLRLLIPAALAATFAISAATAAAPTGGWVGYDTVTDRDAATPSWSDVTHPERFPGCTGRTVDAGLADRVVILEDGDVARWSFERVADSGARFWVVGSC